jgi:hypothetical protein
MKQCRECQPLVNETCSTAQSVRTLWNAKADLLGKVVVAAKAKDKDTRWQVIYCLGRDLIGTWPAAQPGDQTRLLYCFLHAAKHELARLASKPEHSKVVETVEGMIQAFPRTYPLAAARFGGGCATVVQPRQTSGTGAKE